MNREEIEKAKDNSRDYIDLVLNKNYCECNELNKISRGKYCDGSKNVAESIKTLLQYIDQLEKEIKAKEMEHKYDIKMIDEVKGESVNLYKEIRQLEQEIKALKKGQISLMLSRKKWKDRYYKSKRELNKQSKIIDEMAKYIVELIKFNNWEELREAEEVKQYFEKKVEEK